MVIHPFNCFIFFVNILFLILSIYKFNIYYLFMHKIYNYINFRQLSTSDSLNLYINVFKSFISYDFLGGFFVGVVTTTSLLFKLVCEECFIHKYYITSFNLAAAPLDEVGKKKSEELPSNASPQVKNKWLKCRNSLASQQGSNTKHLKTVFRIAKPK